jgi:multiple sugar transport system permease protein
MTPTGLPAEAPPPTTTLRNSFDVARWVRICLLVLWGIFAGFPVYWMAITAFKNQRDIYQGPYFFPFVDFTPTGRAWEFMMGTARDDVLRGLKNSLLLAGVSSFIAVVLGAFAAYGLARYKYKYGPYRNNDLAFLIVSQRIMPPIVAVIALFAMFKAVSLIDTTVGMIIAYTWFNLPLTVFLLTDFMNRIPIEIEQAAAIDGYGKVAQIWKVVLPLAMPGMAAAYLLSFFFAWNDFLLALMLTFRESVTLPIVITNMSAQMEPRWWLISAVGLVAIVPPMVAVVILDRFVERQVLHGGMR